MSIGQQVGQAVNGPVGTVAARGTAPKRITQERQDGKAVKVAELTATVATNTSRHV